MSRVRTKSPSYIVRQDHSYCFRLVLPLRLRASFGRTELRYTLHTGSLSEAKYRARTIAAYVQRLVRLVEGGSSSVATLSPEQLQALIRSYAAGVLETMEDLRLAKPGLSPEAWDEQEETTSLLLLDAREELATLDFTNASRTADHLLSEAGLSLDRTSEGYRKLCLELLKAGVILSQVDLERLQGRYTQSHAEIVDSIVQGIDLPAGSVPTPSLDTSFPTGKNPLKAIVASYTREKERASKWREKSKAENLACYDLFLRFAGESIAVEDITAKLVREYKDALLSLPPNMEKDARYRGKTIPEILALKPDRAMNLSTVNKYINRLSTLLKWAQRQGYLSVNPAEGMQVDEAKRAEELRGVFSQEDLKRLFHAEAYSQDAHNHPYQFWMPVLALFTGARQEELAQLHLSDIRQEGGVWVLDINDSAPDKKLKTKNATRLIPLHPFLLDLGLVRYAEELKGVGYERLFPELPHKRDGYGQTVSRWFNGNGTHPGFRQRCGINPAPGEPKKDFHAFRHTFVNCLKQKRVDPLILHELDGHSHGTMTLDRYGKRYEPQLVLDEVVRKLDFHVTIPLEHLEHSKYARAK